jgi:iron complex outermembrane recepter protein
LIQKQFNNKMKKSKLIATLLFSAGLSLTSYAQEEAKPANNDMYELTLEELMNLPISSASKKEETLFDAPLSSYTITRQDIDKAGSTSIMEALRLAPGVIVREQSNGNYDIHLRGFDNILRTVSDYSKQNILTLIMIDNRPVFSHGNGGIFWETLPVDINDVDRIEIVRGPSSPLFGPNAVSGVINIITKKATNSSLNANVQAGTQHTTIANVWAGTAVKKWSFQASGNFQSRDRFDSDYYQSSTGKFVPGPTLTNFSKYYPDPSQAMNKWGANGSIGYKANEKLSVDLTLGTQSSEVQKNYLGLNGTKLNTTATKSSYVNLASKWGGLSFRGSYLRGHDDQNHNNRPNEYIFTQEEANVEYAIPVGERVTITPGVSYQRVKFDDTDYMVEGSDVTAGFYNGTPTINTAAGFIRSDINITDKWRVLAGLRADKFSTHDNAYLAYELASTYKLNETNLIRFAVTRSNSGSFIGNNYLKYIIPAGPSTNVVITGTKNLSLFTVNMIELGYRSQLSKNFQLDLDVFRQAATDYSAIVTETALTRSFQSLPTTATQVGATLSLNYVPNDKIQIKPFVTVQHTETYDLPSAFVGANSPTLTYSDKKHESTPSVYGGYYINYKISSKLAFNLNGYYFAAHRQYDSSDPTFTSSVGDISSKVLLNAKLNWSVTNKINLFLNGRNVTNNKTREVFGTDHTGGIYLAGASVNLN